MSQQLQTRVSLKCLQNVLMRQEEQSEKQKLKGIIKKIEKNRDKKELKLLNANQNKMYYLLIDGFYAFRDAFTELIKVQKYKEVGDTQIDIVDYLINIQTEIKLTKETLTIENIISKYTVLNLKLKKQYNNITKQFLSQLINKAKQKMKKNQSKKLDPPPPAKSLPSKNKSESQDQSQQRFLAKPPQRVPQRAVQPPRPQRAQPQRPQARKAQLKREEQLKKEMQSKKERDLQLRRQREAENKRQRELQARRQRQAEIRKERDAQHRREVQVKKETGYNRLPKGRLVDIEKYLQSKHDLKFDKTDKAKMKEISQFISSKFQSFMRTTLSKIISIAYLKNKSNLKSGNQITYFAPENNRTYPQAPFYVTPNSKIFVLLYKHKLQLYTQLRSKQFKKQDELRNALQAKTPQVQKKVDKKIENYILKARSSQVPPIEIYQEDIQDKISQTKTPFKPKTKKIQILIDHFLYYLQNHNYLRNSLLLFDAYHY